MPKTESKTRLVFRSLVANACDFLEQSLSSLEHNPKMSLIQFSTAIELFLKARLVLEHWSLIFDNPGKADLSRFLNGDLKSVGFLESLDRLNRIADAGISQKAIQSFEKLQSHRNRLVHFAHPAYSQLSTREIREAVVAEQLRAWYYLHQLFCTKWFSDFSDVMPLVRELDQSMHQRSDYLGVKYSELKEAIERQQAKGVVLAHCPSCSFLAFGRAFASGPLMALFCLVCHYDEFNILARCSACGSENALPASSERVCLKCSKSITIEDLLREHATQPSEEASHQAYCDQCAYTKIATVIPAGNGYACVSCLSPHLAINKCDWCGEMVTGETGSWLSPGCVMCKHHLDEA